MSEFDHIDINLDDVKDPNEPAPEDDYLLEIHSCEGATSKTAGDKMIKIGLKIDDGGGEHHGKFLNEICMLEGGGARLGMWRWAEICKAIGIDGTNLPDAVGAKFYAHVIVEPPTEGFDRPSNRINAVYSKKPKGFKK